MMKIRWVLHYYYLQSNLDKESWPHLSHTDSFVQIQYGQLIAGNLCKKTGIFLNTIFIILIYIQLVLQRIH